MVLPPRSPHKFASTALVFFLLSATPAIDRPPPTLPAYAPIAAMVAGVNPVRLQNSVDRLVAFGTRNDFSETTSTRTHGVIAARDWIAEQFRDIARTSNGRLTVALDTFRQPKTSRTPRAVLESSVIATLRGTSTGRVYVMSSHFDDCDGRCTDGLGIAPGADDNGSSVAAVLEAARVMAATSFEGTIIFACFDGEELGLWGSDHYARQQFARKTPILAVLNDDIIGNSVGGDGISEPDVVRVFSQALPAATEVNRINLVGSENDSPSRELSRFIAEVVPVYIPELRVRQIFRSDRFMRGGDQESFQAVGYAAAVRFVEPHENFAHQHQDVVVRSGVQYGDLPKYIDSAYLRRVTQANVAALATLALGPAPPGDVKMELHRLGYDSTLRWTPSANGVSYEIVWRATDASLWQHSESVGDVTEATVPVSKDDYVLGVRSVDENGLRSPTVYPTAVRE